MNFWCFTRQIHIDKNPIYKYLEIELTPCYTKCFVHGVNLHWIFKKSKHYINQRKVLLVSWVLFGILPSYLPFRTTISLRQISIYFCVTNITQPYQFAATPVVFTLIVINGYKECVKGQSCLHSYWTITSYIFLCKLSYELKYIVEKHYML